MTKILITALTFILFFLAFASSGPFWFIFSNSIWHDAFYTVSLHRYVFQYLTSFSVGVMLFQLSETEANEDHPQTIYITAKDLSMFNFVNIAFSITLGFAIVAAVWFLISHKED